MRGLLKVSVVAFVILLTGAVFVQFVGGCGGSGNWFPC
jgi:hypothetical protein